MGLWLVPFYFADGQELVDGVAQRLERQFRLTARARAPWFDPELAFDRTRGQYDASRLIELLDELPPLEPHEVAPRRVLGLTSVDLFIPVLTYVFGEAQLGGRVALVSSRRLRGEGLATDRARQVLAHRLDVEAVHELGHTAGLLHCLRPGCAMRGSTGGDEVDFKEPALCDACHAAALAHLSGLR